ncbi:hypothetical protein AURANDRAFT_66166 [Aureococcus anophagefferens]|uniref:Calcineurin-like phosphoesterase domain-containing protein n=1 Tax=Aureococcus anophagefferens TaxID=44056 RepID=F0YGL3_AURAN|nr:hypothetical protein AURANDRAFT_66166 [Aureococcus anophagefferens]EGB05775.1 hypothetical protein AURANDRAFT_66166 [Aureococcus anophagefferens]|eukprot:XP_009039614.1 hypothetical protein AURANDRAFT_66166 [Aureococcus anophagefferens]
MASWRVTAANGAGLRCASSVSSAIMCRAYRGEVLRARDAVAGDAGWACVVKPGYGLLWALRRDLERTDAPPSPAPAEPPAPPAPPTPPTPAARAAPAAGAPPAPPLPLLDAPGDRLVRAFRAAEAEEWPAGAPRWPRVAGFGGAWVVHVISDLHTDMAENRDWLARHPSPRTADGAKHCVVVAGDVATKLDAVEATLRALTASYDAVFYVPGNHELWYVGVAGAHEPEAWAEASRFSPGNPPKRDSFCKLLAIVRLCRGLGVRTGPASLTDALHVCPLFSWYRGTFLDDACATASDGASVFTKVRRDVGCCPASPQELGFDAGCAWPAHVQAADARGSFGGGVADAMLRLNERRVAAAPENGAVVTCSHFLPRRELYVGWRGLGKCMGDPRLDAQLRKARCAVHCCGHAHTDFDATHGGVRYVQRALGYPHERYGAFRGPLALEFPP